MNIQIFSSKKSSEARKAERWFKERSIKAQVIDIAVKPMTAGELKRVIQAVGGIERLIDEQAKDQDAVAYVRYISAAQREAALLERQQILKLPIVRNGSAVAVGYQPEVYQQWLKDDK